MSTSIFSFIMSLLWCNVFVLFSTILRHKIDFVLKYGVNFILLIMIVGIVRLFLPIEPHFDVVIGSTSAMPFLQQFLSEEICEIRGLPVSRFDVFITIWATGSAVYITSIIIGILKMNRLASKINAEINPQAQKIMKTIVLDSKPKHKYRIIVSDEVESPMLVGYFVPTILLPSLSLSDEEMSCVLLHEWNHFLYKHLWIKLLFNVLCALLWWNPLLYLIKYDLDYILEVSCDRFVVNNYGDAERLKYVDTMVNVMQQLVNSKSQLDLSSIGYITASPEKIVQRCELILFPPKRLSKRVRITSGAVVLVLVVLSYALIVQPITPPPSEDIGNYVNISSANSYLCENENRKYELFVNGQYFDTLSSSELSSLPYSNLPIKPEEENR